MKLFFNCSERRDLLQVHYCKKQGIVPKSTMTEPPSIRKGRKGGRKEGIQLYKMSLSRMVVGFGSQISRKAVFTVFVSWWLWLAPVGFYFWKFGHWGVVYLRGITGFRLSHQQLKPHRVSLSSCFLSLFCSSISACMPPCYVPWKYWIKPQKL